MFSKKEDIHYSKANTLIGVDCKFEGQFKAKGTIRMDGELTGEVIIDGNLFIGKTGKIYGDIQAHNILVTGEVKGNINAQQQLRIASGGSLFGDVNVKTFILDEDAYFEGNCKMNPEDHHLPQREHLKEEA